jgi:hypothetical protein
MRSLILLGQLHNPKVEVLSPMKDLEANPHKLHGSEIREVRMSAPGAEEIQMGTPVGGEIVGDP